MIPLPESLKALLPAAQQYLAQNLVRDIAFSGGTYQVQVCDADTQQDMWAFVQLDGKGQIKDSFCSCEREEEEESPAYCTHIAAAFLRIYNGNELPLHQRFQRSLWNQLCQLYADRTGYDSSLLTAIAPGYYVYTSAGGKAVFFIKGKSQSARTRLKKIIEERPKETEETSLKFSNLTQEEIILWREGRPSPQLRYELSFWNDLAQWLLLLQDMENPYDIRFEYSTRQVPNYIEVSFAEIEVGFYLSEANLPQIIPALATVKSPLTVHNAPQDAIQSITYDKKSGSLLIEAKDKQASARQKAGEREHNGKSEVNGWLYAPEDGFYAKDPHHLLATPCLAPEQVGNVLNEHFHIIQPLLKGCTLHLEPIQATYSIAFDAKWNLHITCYASTPGDLNAPYSRYFGDWIYLDEDGFYRLEEQHFEELEKIIPHKEVSDFIRNERTWLNTQEGFQTHVTSLEAQLEYTLSAENRLSFNKLVAVNNRSTTSHDFGSWIYMAGQGFYSKGVSSIGISLRPGTTLNADQIPLFIHMNREDLHLVPHFFSESSPVAQITLHIELLQNETIQITPQYEVFPQYRSQNVRFFDDFSFVAGEGFHAIPQDAQIPERFHHPVLIQPENLAMFLTYELEGLRQYASHIDSRLTKAASMHLSASHISLAEGEEKGWYVLKLNYTTDSASLAAYAVWSAIKKKKRFLFADVGLVDIEEKRYNWLRLLPKSRLERRNHTIQLSTLELIRLNAMDAIRIEGMNEEEEEKANTLLRELTEFSIPNEPDITGLRSELRPYQKLGLRWLWFLHYHSLSGLLCDDMGLGKTHQTMALLAAILAHYEKQRVQNPNSPQKTRYFLIICPTSVLYHWQEKLANFLPQLRVCTFYGNDRNVEEFHQNYDVLLTSYGIWRIENELLSTISFEVAIFDEVQIAKNHNSRVHASLLNVNSKMRLGLTGTPIENHLRELKSLFDLALPTYMPGDADYRELFIKPIEKEGNQESRALLSRFIKPFMMRRKKEDVLTDLPEKTEEIAHCILLPEQQMLYNEVLSQSRQSIMQKMQEDGSAIPYIHIFALLSGLKQICDHPAVYLKSAATYKNYPSGKWELFIELLNEARESQQKVVIFSQYLTMLDIFESYLSELGVGFATIRGSTTNRGEQLRRFNNDPDCQVFIGSLQASGLGVDLTAGSVVIHYDRWWNAARENQATDRVHRIGQKRGVQVFKLVTKGTFEERIDALIAKKGRLMEDVIGIDDHQIIKHFNRDEIMQLLQLVEVG